MDWGRKEERCLIQIKSFGSYSYFQKVKAEVMETPERVAQEEPVKEIRERKEMSLFLSMIF